MDLHGVLVGFRCAEYVGFAHRDGGVAGDQHLHDPTDRLQSQREGRDVVEHQIAQLAGEDAGLHCGPNRHHFIGVHRLTGLAWHQGAHHLLHHRHAGGASHQHHIVDVVGGHAGIAQGALHRAQQAVEKIGAQALKGAALEGGLDVEGAFSAGGDERQGNRGAAHAGELLLGLLRRLGEALQCLAVAAQVEAMVLLEGICQPVDDASIPVVATQLGVPAGGLDIEDAVSDAQHRHIEGAPPQVEHQHPAGRAAVKAIGQGRGGGLIEDAFHLQPRQATGIAGGLALGVVEVGGNGDHRRLHRLPQVGGGVVDELAQDRGHQLFRGIFALGGGANDAHVALVVGAHRVGNSEAALLELIPDAPDETLEVGERVAGIEHQLAAGQLAHQQLLLAAEPHHRRGGAPPLGAGDHLGTAALQHRHHRIGGAKVDADDPPHGGSAGLSPWRKIRAGVAPSYRPWPSVKPSLNNAGGMPSYIPRDGMNSHLSRIVHPACPARLPRRRKDRQTDRRGGDPPTESLPPITSGIRSPCGDAHPLKSF